MPAMGIREFCVLIEINPYAYPRLCTERTMRDKAPSRPFARTKTIAPSGQRSWHSIPGKTRVIERAGVLIERLAHPGDGVAAAWVGLQRAGVLQQRSDDVVQRGVCVRRQLAVDDDRIDVAGD